MMTFNEPQATTTPLTWAESQRIMFCAAAGGAVTYNCGHYYYVAELGCRPEGPYGTAGRALIGGHIAACCRQTLRQIVP